MSKQTFEGFTNKEPRNARSTFHRKHNATKIPNPPQSERAIKPPGRLTFHRF
jgi:hypothetical protein